MTLKKLKKLKNKNIPEDTIEPICLIEAINQFKVNPKPIRKPTRVVVYDFYVKNQDGSSALWGDCCSVKVESGVVKEKTEMILMPHDVKVQVRAIEHN